MCVCRYYVAEGVRLYSQESWRLVTENKGVQLVETYIQNVVSIDYHYNKMYKHVQSMCDVL